MKEFLKKRFLGMPILVSVILVTLLFAGGVVWAATSWQSTNLTGEGKVYVTTPTPPPPPPANYDYTAETTIVFGDVYPVTGGPINVSTAIVVGNIGNRTITGFSLANIVYPAGIVTPSLTVADVTILPGGDADVVFTLTGTAPASVQTIDLAGVTCTLTPTGP